MTSAPDLTRRAALLLVLAAVVLGAALRLYHLGAVPPGMHPDEAHYAEDAVSIMNGWRPVFLPANNGREPLFVYFMAGLFSLLGPTLWTARLAGAIVGVLMIPAQYLFSAALPLPRPRWTAAVAAALVAFTFWPVSQSHQALRAGLLPVWVALMAWAWWRATDDRRPTTDDRRDHGRPTTDDQLQPTLHPPRWSVVGGRWSTSWSVVGGPSSASALAWAALTGLILAAAIYTHLSARLMPPILVGSALWLAARRRTWTPLAYLAVALGLAGLLSAPLILYFVQNPDMATLRTGQISVLNPEVNKGNLPLTLLQNAWSILLMTNVRGTTSWLENLRGRPVFDPLMGLFFLGGVLLLARDLLNRRGEKAQSAAVLVLLVYVFQVMPSWLSAGAPSYGRLNGAWAVLFLLPAWAMERGAAWLSPRLGRAVTTAAVVGILVVSAAWSARDFFGVYAHAAEVYDVFFGWSLDRARAVADIVPSGTAYASPTLWNQSVIRFNNVQNPPRVVDTRAGLALPAEGDAVYLFDPADAREADAFGQRWPEAVRSEVKDSRGGMNLIVYRLPQAARPGIDATPAPAEAAFGENIRLATYRVGGERVAPGGTARVTLIWEALAPTDIDHNLFVHLVDASGRTVGQADGPPLGGSFPTTVWRPGETVVQQINIPIIKDAPTGPAHLRLGWYDWRSGERLPVPGSPDSSVSIGQVQIQNQGSP